MGEHLIDGEFQSDKYPTCPRGKVPLSCKDAMAQDLLWEYAQRRRQVDAEFADDLEHALRLAGYKPPFRLEHERRRDRVVKAYYDELGEWPQATFVDRLMQLTGAPEDNTSPSSPSIIARCTASQHQMAGGYDDRCICGQVRYRR